MMHRVDTYALRPGPGGRVLVDPQEHLPGAVARALGLPGLRLFDTSDDALTSEREHWAHASNVLALSPGRVVTYERNGRSHAPLRKTGIEVITGPGSELGRGRGGPRCMVAPMARRGLTAAADPPEPPRGPRLVA